MQKRILLLLFALPALPAGAQFSGGAGEGFTYAQFSRQSNSEANAFRGGAGDGFTLTDLSRQALTDNTAFVGGSNDGFAVDSFNKQTLSDNTAFRGGSEDGFVSGLFIRPNLSDATAFRGGVNDGFSTGNFTRQNLADAVVYYGGPGRGENQVLLNKGICGVPGVQSVWNGSVSNVWSEPGNWNCNVVPGVTSVVIVPSGLARYPTVFGSTEVRSLALEPGATVTVPTGIQLKLNGQ